MPRTLVALAITLPLTLWLSLRDREAPKPDTAPKKVSGFELKDPRDQKTIRLADLKDKKAIVVVFLGTECPLSNPFLPVLRGCTRNMRARRRISRHQCQPAGQPGGSGRSCPPTRHCPSPSSRIPATTSPTSFGARRTPEAFVLTAAGNVVYQRPHRRSVRHRLRPARQADAPRPGRSAWTRCWPASPYRMPTTPVAGCLIGRVAKPKADGGCHLHQARQPHLAEQLPGMSSPRSDRADVAVDLTTMRVAWSDTIREVIERGTHAALARRSPLRQVLERPPAVEGGPRDAAGLARPRHAARRRKICRRRGSFPRAGRSASRT